MELEIRHMQSEELDTQGASLLALVYSEAPAETIDEFKADRENPFQKFIGAWCAGTLVGMAGYCMSPATTKLIELNYASVLPEYRGKGIGKKLLNARLSLSRNEHIQSGRTLLGWLVHTQPTRLYLARSASVFQCLDDGKAIIFIPNK